MKVGSLFSGIGGFDLGLERAGMQVVWQSEIEPWRCSELRRHWPRVPNLGDIFKIKRPPTVDLVCGGPPCQPFSTAGKRRGTKDDRHLWPQMLRIIQNVRPSWVVVENVLGVVGLALQQMLSDLENSDYKLPQDIEGRPVVFNLPACAVDAWHRRERIWIIAHTDSCRRNCGPDIPVRGQTKTSSPTFSSGQSKTQPSSYADETGRTHSQGSTGSTEPPERKKSFTDVGENAQAYIWEIEPDVGVLVHGLPKGLDPVGALGDAIVPQIAEEIGKMILEITQAEGMNAETR